MDQRLITERYQPDLGHHLRHDFSGVAGQAQQLERRRAKRPGNPRPEAPGTDPRLLPHADPGPGVEVVRHPEGPIEIKLSGLVGALERRAQRWRAAALVVLVGLAVGASVVVAVLAMRWDYQRGRVLQLLRADLEIAQARARCWEALARYLPESPQDVIPDTRRGEWVRQCVTTELGRFNLRR